MRIVLLGAPGSGKGTQARLISSKYGVVHLSMGQMLREEVENGSQLGQRIAPVMHKGEMVPDEVINPLLSAQLEGLPAFVLDGYPRSIAQAKYLEALLSSWGQVLNAVFLLEAETELIVERLSGRRVCQVCGKTYHVNFYKSNRCTCGGKLTRRSDDRPEVIRNRMAAYRQSIRPIREFYDSRNLLYQLDANRTAEAVYTDICHILDEQILPYIEWEKEGDD